MHQNDLNMIIDGDGVALDFSHGFLRYMKEEHKIFASANEPRHFNYSDIFAPNVNPASYIKGFIDSPYFEQIPFYPDAIEKLHAIKANGVAIRMVTSCGDSPHVQRMRLACIEREVGKIIEDVIFLPLGAGKVDTLKKFAPSTFVDDQLSMCIDGALAGHRSYLFNRLYNQSASLSDMSMHNIYRAHSWDCLPQIGHDNAPRTPLERQALALLTATLHSLHDQPLSEAQKRTHINQVLSQPPLNLPIHASELLTAYVQSPAQIRFPALDREGGLLCTIQNAQERIITPPPLRGEADRMTPRR